jgi:hypothetical protein
MLASSPIIADGILESPFPLDVSEIFGEDVQTVIVFAQDVIKELVKGGSGDMAITTELDQIITLTGAGFYDIMIPIVDRVFDIFARVKFDENYVGEKPQIFVLDKDKNIRQTVEVEIGPGIWNEVNMERLRGFSYIRLKSNTTDDTAKVFFTLPEISWVEHIHTSTVSLKTNPNGRFYRGSLRLSTGLQTT